MKQPKFTKKGIVQTMYDSQKSSSKKRQHNVPAYSKKEFKQWLYSQKNFNRLYKLWKKSGYKSLLKHSVDRNDDDIGYSFSNITLMTWGENKKKGYKSRTIKHYESRCRLIKQFKPNGQLIATYESLKCASIITGINRGNISSVCCGYRKTAGGFKWE